MIGTGKVILLTGAANSGKSTLAREASAAIRPLYKVDFGQRLLELKKSRGYPDLTYEQLRNRSAQIITPEDVRMLDENLISDLPKLRTDMHVLPKLSDFRASASDSRASGTIGAVMAARPNIYVAVSGAEWVDSHPSR